MDSTEDKKLRRVLKPDEAKRMLQVAKETAPEHIYRAIVIAMLTGLRQSHIMDLKFGDLNLVGGILWIPKHRFMANSNRDFIIPINSQLMAFLRTTWTGNPEEPVIGKKVKDLNAAYKAVAIRAGFERDFTFANLRYSYLVWLHEGGLSINNTMYVLLGKYIPEFGMRMCGGQPTMEQLRATIETLPKLFPHEPKLVDSKGAPEAVC